MKKISRKSIQFQLILYLHCHTYTYNYNQHNRHHNNLQSDITQAEIKCISDSFAREIQEQAQIESVTRLIVARSFISVIENNDSLQKDLQTTRHGRNLIYLPWSTGTVLSGWERIHHGRYPGDKFIARANTGLPVTGTDIVLAEELGKETHELVDKASIILSNCEIEAEKSDARIIRMVLESAVPCLTKQKPVGVLIGGVL
jgi:hypothetical protein